MPKPCLLEEAASLPEGEAEAEVESPPSLTTRQVIASGQRVHHHFLWQLLPLPLPARIQQAKDPCCSRMPLLLQW